MKDIITKSNFFVTAYYKLTLTEMQVLIYAIKNINPFENDNSSLRQRIRVLDFAKAFNRSHKEIYQDIQDSVENRLWDRKIIFWNKQEQGMQRTRLVSTVIYSELKGEFIVQFPIELKPLLLELKSNFTSYYIKNISNFKSIYSLRIYEICVMEINKSKQSQSILDMAYEEIKKILMLSNKYNRFIDFKRRVLTKARTEINIHSDLTIDFEEIKKGRKVDAIKFIVERKPGTKRASYADEENKEVPAYPPLVQDGNSAYKCSDTQATSKLSSSDDKVNAVIEESGYKPASYTNYTESQREAIKAARQCGLKHKLAIEEVEGYGSDAVLKAAKKINEKIAKGHDINNIAGYLRTCLKEDEIVMDSEQYRARLETEEAEKARKAIELEKRWVEFDRYCSKNKDDIVPLLGKIHKNIVLEYHEELFLGDIQSKISTYEDIKKHHQLFTDIFVETDSGRHYLKFNQLSSLIFKPKKVGVA